MWCISVYISFTNWFDLYFIIMWPPYVTSVLIYLYCHLESIYPVLLTVQPDRTRQVLQGAYRYMFIKIRNCFTTEWVVFISYIIASAYKIMAYITFHKWLVLVCNIHMPLWMLQSKTSHLWKVSYPIILLGWQHVIMVRRWRYSCPTLKIDVTLERIFKCTQ